MLIIKEIKKHISLTLILILLKLKIILILFHFLIRYSKGYYELVKDYKKEYEEKQKTTREDRRKSFDKMLDDSNSVVADELLFTSDNEFFKGMSKKDIKKWADTCMEFVYNDLGYTKEQVLHSEQFIWTKKHHICIV